MSVRNKETESLSARETEVLHWLHSGKSNWEIGQILELSQHTVKNHVSNILKKRDASNRHHAAVRAAELGLAVYE